MPTSVENLLKARQSTRAFLPDPVSRETTEHLLWAARRAPSGANLQPGSFHALTGRALAGLVTNLTTAIDDNRPQVAEYEWFPRPIPPHLKARQRAAGYALYQALGIERRDIDGRRRQFKANYRFFDAPLGIIVSIDRHMGEGGFMDLGMSIMALMLAAQDRGLGTVGIGAMANYADVVHETLALPPDEMVLCGIAIGYPDEHAVINGFRTEREPLDSYATLRGFD
ncbi:nitroreductase [Thioclava sp. FTW29]|uniref:Nitroreductase n=1 Tax=Thioclava litoralis TaxID=3076557 RepID=A0ABZ1E358_9RHOB|nr:nitroreductase [Thioclava sp. FTW29]